MHINRHSINRPLIEEVYLGELERVDYYLESARTKSNSLSLLAMVTKFVVTHGSIIAPSSRDVARGVMLNAQANTALLVFATIETPPRYCRLGEGPPVTYTEPVNPSSANVSVWFRACELALVSRQAESIQLLQTVETDFLRARSHAPETTYQHVGLLRALTQPMASQSEAFQGQAEYYTSCKGKSEHHKAVRLLGLPYLELIRVLDTGDGAKFEAALIEACRQHGKFYGSTENLRKDSDGFVSTKLTAVAAIAFDRGLQFNPNVSDYVPASWVTGEIFTALH